MLYRIAILEQVKNAQYIGGYLNPVYFTATGMIGMIALSGIVTRYDNSRFHDLLLRQSHQPQSQMTAITSSQTNSEQPSTEAAGVIVAPGRW